MKRAAFVLFLFICSGVKAQTFQTTIRHYSVTQNADRLLVDVYFSITDMSKNIVENLNVTDVELSIQTANGTETAHAVPSIPTSPLYIMIAADMSGSMTSAYQNIVSALTEIGNNAPQNARFALMSFTDQPVLEVDFTQGIESVLQKLLSLRPRSSTGTCFYNAVNKALEILNSTSVPGRRALIVMSDGHDRRLDGSRCSTFGFDQVIATAQTTPVFVIGIRGGEGLNTSDLTNLAIQTGGTYLEDTSLNVGSQLQAIVSLLSQQWFAQFAIYPQQGNYSATLTPILENGIRGASTQFNVISSRNYSAPFQLCDSSQTTSYDAQRDVIRYNFCAIGLDRIQTLTYRLIEKDSNQTVLNTQIVGNLLQPIEIYGTQTGLTPGQRYILVPGGTGIDGNPLFAPDDSSQRIEFLFKGNQTVQDVNMRVTNFRVETGEIVISISSGIELIDSIEITPIADSGNMEARSVITNITRNVSTFLDLNELLPDARYTLEIIALSGQGTILYREERNFETPPAVTPQLTIVTANQSGEDEHQTYSITFNTINLGEDVSFYYQLIDENNATPVNGRLEQVPDILEIPISSIPSGEYLLTLRILDENGNILLEENRQAILDIGFSFAHRIASFLRSPIGLLILVSSIFVTGGLAYRMYGPRQTHKPTMPEPNVVRVKTTNVESLEGWNRSTQQFTGRALTEDVTQSNRKNLPRSSIAQIIIAKSKSFGQNHTIELDGDPLTFEYCIGRSGCNLNFNDSDLVVSRKHIEIKLDLKMRRFLIINYSSKGSVINNIPLGKGSHLSVPMDKDITICLPNREGVIISFRPTLKL